MTITPFGWNDDAAPALDATNLEKMLSEAGAYTDEETARAEAAEVLLAPLDSPTFTGTPEAPTPTAGDNTTKIATTAFVTTAVAGGGSGGPTYTAGTGITIDSDTISVTGSTYDAYGAATAEQTRAESAESLLAPLSSPTLTGSPTAPTQATADNSTKLATTAYADRSATNAQTAAEAASIPAADMGADNGVATLDATGNVPASQLGNAPAVSRSPDVYSITSSATPTVDCDSYDELHITALAVNITGITITGTPGDSQSLIIEFTDDGTARSITWPSANFGAMDQAPLPITTTVGKTTTAGLKWSASATKWINWATGTF